MNNTSTPPTPRPRWGSYHGRLTREQVQAKYSPRPDPLWTLEREQAFFAKLPSPGYRYRVPLDAVRSMLVRGFGATDLKAQRMGTPYVATLGSILGLFADADGAGVECLISQRDAHLGPANIIRSVLTQLHSAGLMVKETRPQGHGFVGTVFVYAPQGRYRGQKATVCALERAYRGTEGESPAPSMPANLTDGDVPY